MLAGADAANVHYLRTLGDAERIRAELGPSKRMVVIGGGFIGLEMGAAAVKCGCQVTVLESAERVLVRVTAPEMSAFYQGLHGEAGVDICTGARLRRLAMVSGRVVGLELDDGADIPADFLVVGIGLLANVELARDAGLEVGDGIVVDEYGKTSDVDIFAVGDCALQVNAPLFVGVNTLNTRETVLRCREILGKFSVDGFLLGRPMWLPMDDRAIVDYYKSLAEALPGVALIPYDNPLAFKGKISHAVYRELSKMPEIVAAKHTGGPNLLADLEAVGRDMMLLPIDLEWCEPAEKYPDLVRAAWSGNVACFPEPIAALSRAIRQRDWTRAKKLSERLNWATTPQFAGNDFGKFMSYSIQIGRGRFLGAGLIAPGPSRPPYAYVPQALLEGGLEAGRRMK